MTTNQSRPYLPPKTLIKIKHKIHTQQLFLTPTPTFLNQPSPPPTKKKHHIGRSYDFFVEAKSAAGVGPASRSMALTAFAASKPSVPQDFVVDLQSLSKGWGGPKISNRAAPWEPTTFIFGGYDPYF